MCPLEYVICLLLWLLFLFSCWIHIALQPIRAASHRWGPRPIQHTESAEQLPRGGRLVPMVRDSLQKLDGRQRTNVGWQLTVSLVCHGPYFFTETFRGNRRTALVWVVFGLCQSMAVAACRELCFARKKEKQIHCVPDTYSCCKAGNMSGINAL